MKFIGVPLQPFNVGVAVTVETIVAPVVFVAVNAAISPVPLAPKPVAVLSFVQFTVAVGDEVNVIAVVCCPAHND